MARQCQRPGVLTTKLDDRSPRPTPRLSCAEFARQAGVSRQAVHDAVKHCALVRDEDGLIDTECGPNRSYLEFHVHGVDRNLRDMRTYGRPIGTEKRERVPIEISEGGEFNSP